MKRTLLSVALFPHREIVGPALSAIHFCKLRIHLVDQNVSNKLVKSGVCELRRTSRRTCKNPKGVILSVVRDILEYRSRKALGSGVVD